MDLSTTYLGLKLANPFVAGASPLSGTLDMVKRLEDGGAAAIVLPSLFEEQIKALLAGADVVQVVSALLRRGPSCFTAMRDGLTRWMDANQMSSLGDVRGRLSIAANADASLFERASYLRTLQSWDAKRSRREWDQLPR